MADRSGYLTPQQKEELEDLAVSIRALLTPHKHGSELHTLQSSYSEFYGGQLPFRKFGFNSVTDLLLGLPNAVRIVNKSGQVLLYAVEIKETSHIAKLVRQQKSSKKPKSAGKNSRGRMFAFPSYRGRGGRSVATSRGHSFPNAEAFRKPVSSSRPTTATTDSGYRKSPQGFSKPTTYFQQIQRQQNSAPPNRTSAVDSRADVSAKAELETLSRALGYGVPVYNILPYKDNFMCSVSVGPHRGGSLREYPSRLTAECAAARSAINTCKQYLLTTKSDSANATTAVNRPLQNGSNSADKINEDFEHLVENILQLLDKHPSGLLSTHLPAKYFSRFGVNLPEDWLNQLEENAHEIAVDRIDVFRCIIAKQLAKPPPAIPAATHLPVERPDSPPPLFFTNIVPLRKPDSPPPIPVTPQVANDENAVQTDSFLKPRVAFDDARNAVFEFHMSEEEQELKSQPVVVHPANPRLLRLPETEYFEIFVTVAASPADFFVRIMEPDCANEFNDLRQKMDDYYSKNEGELIENSSDFLPSRHFYAAREEESWHRVTPVEILPESRQAKVHFIDHGDFETIDFANMRQLEPEFIGCPVQAVRCCLENFDSFGYDDFSEELIEKFQSLVVERSFVAQRYISAENSGTNVYESGSVLNLVVYGEDPGEPAFCLNTAMESMLPPEKLADIASSIITTANEQNDERALLAENGEIQSNDNSIPVPVVLSEAVSSKEGEDDDDDDDEISGDIYPLTDFDDAFEAYVTFAFDPSEFRIRPVNLSEHLSHLTSEMSDFYGPSGRGDQLTVSAAQLSEFYAVSIDGSWFRAFCSNPDCSNAVVLFLIDSGEFYSCPLSCLRQLPRKFRRLSSTIIQCCLKNLSPADKSKYYDADSASAFFQKTMGDGGAAGRVFKTKVSSHCVKNAPRKPALAFAELDDMIDRESGESLVGWLVSKKYAVVDNVDN